VKFYISILHLAQILNFSRKMVKFPDEPHKSWNALYKSVRRRFLARKAAGRTRHLASGPSRKKIPRRRGRNSKSLHYAWGRTPAPGEYFIYKWQPLPPPPQTTRDLCKSAARAKRNPICVNKITRGGILRRSFVHTFLRCAHGIICRGRRSARGIKRLQGAA
jgi:hypothetical protein